MQLSRRAFVAAAAGAITIPLMGNGCRNGGPLKQSELPVYTWEQMDELYPLDEWDHHLTGQYERRPPRSGRGWQRVGFLRGTRRRAVLWAKRKG